MYISEKIIYLALHKTGCSHVLKLLHSVAELSGREIGKHNTIYQVPANALGNFDAKIKSGNIRNPWDWYVSLWAFGCMKKGALYEQIINKNILKKILHPRSYFTPVAKWKAVYENPDDPALFREWLKMVLQTRRKDIIHFGDEKVSLNIGLLTYRYLQLYNYDFQKNISVISTQNDVADFDKKNNFINHFLRNESLEPDFMALMKNAGIETELISATSSIPKTNASKRKSYASYYNEETINMVAEQEAYIIQKHAYSFDAKLK